MNLFDMDKPRYTLNQPVRLFESFSGIGTQAMALKRLGVEIEHVGISEIDKHAIASYMAIHGDVKNYGNIMDIKGSDLGEIDLFTWSFPCTDLSKAGKQKGLDGTRSGLGYQVIRIIGEMEVKPKVLLMENVPDLLSEKFKEGWREMYHDIENMGYTNYVEVLNAKNYGVAQNRDRVFMVSILGDYSYTFPRWVKLEKRLKDYLEDDVDEKYYLSEKQLAAINNPKYESMGIDRIPNIDDDTANAITTSQGGNREPKISYAINSREFAARGWMELAPTLCARDYKDPKVILEPKCLNSKVNGKQPSLQDRIYDTEEISTAITTAYMPSIAIGIAQRGRDDGQQFESNGQELANAITTVQKDSMIAIPEATKQGYALAHNGDGVYINRPHQKRGTVQKEMIQTIKTSGDDIGVVDNLRIRKLCPIETWRLMGISDEDFYKAQKVCSNSQLYKQAGNAIVVDVLENIFKEII